MPPDDMRGELAGLGSRMGARIFGVADIGTAATRDARLTEYAARGYTRSVVYGMRLHRSVLNDIIDKPTPLYFHHYRQINYQLDRLALLAAGMLQDEGWLGLAVPASQTTGRNPMTGLISHRALAWAAGLGFIGRNALVVHPEYGAQARYVSILTDLPVDAGAPCAGDCGSCAACVSACPARAIGGTADEFDLDACYRQLCEFVKLPFVGQHICGLCVKACGGAVKAGRRVWGRGSV